jgi:Ca-activated chloride channel family protein
MFNKSIKCVFCIFAVCLLSGCEDAPLKLKLVEGNFYFGRGMYNEAISAYFEARASKKLAAYADLALGSTYLVMEQNAAALERFTLAEGEIPDAAVREAEKRALLYRIHYNTGVVKFQQSFYKEAAESFRLALLADSAQREAKRNLELCIISKLMKNDAAVAGEINTGTVAEEQDKRRSEIIFDFVRRHERDKWKGWEWSGDEEPGGPDY